MTDKDIAFLSPKGTLDLKKWAEFQHSIPAGVVYTDFGEVCEEIINETNFIAGDNKGIVDTPINLKIFSTDVVNLTLVDLPGMTKIPVGEQPDDIELQIEKMIKKYIENPKSVILAVTAANTDLATSEALKFAKRIDPEGARTLAVLTKLDLMNDDTENGTEDATEVLTGSLIPVKLGIIGVVNRTQKDIDGNKPMDKQLEKEAKFLAENYPLLAAQHGTPFLAKTLSNLLMTHIEKCLPELRVRVNAKMTEIQKLNDALGKEVIDKDKTLLDVIEAFSKAYKTTIEGTSSDSETSGPTKLYSIIHDGFTKTIEAIKPVVDEQDQSIIDVLSNSMGSRPTLFNNPDFDVPFGKLVKKQISLFNDPSLKCLDQVHMEMLKNIQECGSDMQLEMQRFPILKGKMFDIVTKLINSHLKVVKARVADVIDVEKAYINIMHPDFKPEIKIELKTRQTNTKAGDAEEQKKNLEILGKLINAYLCVSRKTIQDIVPKTIMRFLVNEVAGEIKSELIQNLYKVNGDDNILQEEHGIKTRREGTKKLLEVRFLYNLFDNFVLVDGKQNLSSSKNVCFRSTETK